MRRPPFQTRLPLCEQLFSRTIAHSKRALMGDTRDQKNCLAFAVFTQGLFQHFPLYSRKIFYLHRNFMH